jgi:hypothetical protein
MSIPPRIRLPTRYQWPEIAEEGGFIGYGPRLVQMLLARADEVME